MGRHQIDDVPKEDTQKLAENDTTEFKLYDDDEG